MRSILKMAAVGGALLLATSLLVMAGDKPAKGEKHGKRGDMMESVLGKLNLTDDQKAKIKEIREKYVPEFQEFEKAHKAEIEAAREAKDFAKMKEIMQPIAGKREAMMKEIGGVLNDEQKAEMKKHFAGKGGHGKKHEEKQ
ncbi:MAG: Spy/CpxP family protein refolding chaperone [Verrucomicrobia bacterium]|nr:Spy/CpxP family protein refolding chaperone [Verrucomicrobiota bacterium]